MLKEVEETERGPTFGRCLVEDGWAFSKFFTELVELVDIDTINDE